MQRVVPQESVAARASVVEKPVAGPPIDLRALLAGRFGGKDATAKERD
jgi:hypothetical protein